MRLKKIISGGQTGADFAGVMAGRFRGLETGGFIPAGRRTDEGPMPEVIARAFGFVETEDASYAPRTEANVLNSDGTILFGRMASPGCRLTIKTCRAAGKPYLINPGKEQLRKWLNEHRIEVLNVAGNRERTNPGIFLTTFEFLVDALPEPTLFDKVSMRRRVTDWK